MKRIVLLLTFISATSATRTLAAHNTEVAAVVHLQQQAVVEGVIKHCKMGIQKEGDAPNALECVVDTFQACVNEKCMDVPARVAHCLRDYDEYGKLTGPSRYGKTALAKAIAATIDKLYSDMGNGLKVKFIEVNYLMITNIASLKEVISYAFQTAPCILFIDEIHLLGLQKTGNKELLNEFLTQLTELHRIKDPAKQVFIIGATNHPELLAPELFKHERFLVKLLDSKSRGSVNGHNFLPRILKNMVLILPVLIY